MCRKSQYRTRGTDIDPLQSHSDIGKRWGDTMEREERLVRIDDELKIEAYQFVGIMQKFPNHFHEYYVIGFVEAGRRYLTCKNREYVIDAGDLLMFNFHVPGQNPPALAGEL